MQRYFDALATDSPAEPITGLRRQFQGHTDVVYSIACSPDGETLVERQSG